jgi:hypothetical protein
MILDTGFWILDIFGSAALPDFFETGVDMKNR